MCRTWMGYCPIELKAGLGRWARRASGSMGRARQAEAGQGAAGARGRRAARARGKQASGARRRTGHVGWAAWARPGRAAGPMGCALGALSLF